ncbi:NACHT domain-containing NTPase [Brasilonema sp. UFV-L1]|uniref:NACHT domain-containing protein n=1 Tax=Brasilonema sp. UFV-L1 TaxID=2234130 RepID=UPI002006EC4C|nr:NACHT domain-containing NTPase [Brasilonema sp. UFV-L1]
MSLPESFLTQLEQYSELSQREKEVFLEIFGRGKSRVEVTQAINISDSNLGSCLTGIYKKFSISGSGPIKENRLREYLSKRYAQQQPSGHLTIDISDNDIDTLVQEIREQVKPSIKERCGTMRVLDMTQPIELTGERGIYTNVNILEKITGRRRQEIAELLQNCDVENFERFGLSRVSEKRVPGLEAVQRYSKLIVLGKPGAGKTTFLKYLAMQCIQEQFQTNRVPLFITLKNFAEESKQPNILEYIAQQLSVCGVSDANLKVEELLRQGKALILLDGLDEVREEDTKRILRQIREVCDQFHTNQLVITCRIASKEYTFERFTEVEVADFDEEQIAIFAQNWFRAKDFDNCHAEWSDSGVKHLEDSKDSGFYVLRTRFANTPLRSAQNDKAEKFIQKLKDNKPIQELATNPLLLTLLCLVFGEAGNFPVNRSELYKEGLDVLLKKWDAKRNIERDQVYKNLSLQRKEDLLSQIALTTFEQKDYFFKQKTVEAYIADFIRNLRDARTEPKELELDSEAVLRSIEGQHGLLVERAKGIYSFSHLTFQEYFAAWEIVANSAWEKLVEHITEKRWREVFLLTAGMMRKADDLVWFMKRKVDGLVASDEKLQEFLTWNNHKSLSEDLPYKPIAVRAFYFLFYLSKIKPTAARSVAKFFANTFDIGFKLSSKLEVEIVLARVIDEAVMISYNFGRAHTRTQAIHLLYDIDTVIELDHELRYQIEDLKCQLPDPFQREFKEWWQIKGKVWIEQLRAMMIEHRNIGHDWQFSEAQKQLLQQYYDANKLLVDCLNSDCYVSREVRQEIEETLLLPMAEIEKRQG